MDENGKHGLDDEVTFISMGRGEISGEIDMGKLNGTGRNIAP